MHNPDREFAEYVFGLDKKKGELPENLINLDDTKLESFMHVVKDANKVPLQTKAQQTPLR